jgi:hypothetical protein
MEFDRRADYDRQLILHRKHPWRCLRHSKTGVTMSPTERVHIFEAEARKSDRYPKLDQLFWDNHSGFAHGPGFRAWANDFPPGTTLRVTAEIILPEGKHRE